MSDAYVYRVMRAEETLAAGKLMSQALHFDFPKGDDQMVEWMERRGVEHWRVVEVAGELAAVLNILPMGQWFGGASIASAGIAGVGVAAQFRGRRVGAFMMAEMLKEMHSQGVPLSTLYPATTTFYRGLGYERAGTRIIYQAAAGSIQVRERDVTLRQVTPEARSLLHELYSAWAQTQNGLLDRSETLWNRYFQSFNAQPLFYVLEEQGRPVGYLIYTQGNQNESMNIVDWCALTPAALRAIWQFIGDHRTMINAVRWPGAAVDTLVHALPEQHHERYKRLDWMLRIVDLPAALQARGYPQHVQAAISIDVADELFPENGGTWTLQLEAGRLSVERGGAGSVKLHIRDLAAIFTNYLAPQQLFLAGSVRGLAADLETLGALFAGPAPWMPDMF